MPEPTIKATDSTIHQIVKDEIARLGVNADLNHIDVSDVTDMSYMFLDSCFNGDISKWDVSNVKNMRGMFSGSQFNGDISQWKIREDANLEDFGIPLPERDNPEQELTM